LGPLAEMRIVDSRTWIGLNLVASEISDLCKISGLLLFIIYFALQSRVIKFGDYFFDVCCVN